MRAAAIAEIWRETLRTLGRYSIPILLCALFGLAGADLLGQLVNSALTIDVYIRSGGILPTYSATYYAQLLIQAGLGVFSVSLARGAITWLTLQRAPDAEKAPLRTALRTTAARMPALLLSTLAYGAVVLMGIVGLALLLRQLRLDVTSIGRVAGDFDSLVQVFLIRVVNSFVPDPGAPLAQLLEYARYVLRRSTTNYYWLYAYRSDLGDVPLRVWLLGLAGFIPIALAGTLFRFFDASIMSAATPNRLAAFSSAMQLAGRHLRLVLRHALVLWLAGALLNSVFVALPLALAQYLLVPALARAVNSLWPYPASSIVFGAASTIIDMLLGAFVIVYNAHLYQALGVDERSAQQP